jgi:hypothetical protein
MGERKAGQAIEVFLFLQGLAINGVVSFGRENMRKVGRYYFPKLRQ